MSKHPAPLEGAVDDVQPEDPYGIPQLDIRDSVPLWSLYVLFCTMLAVIAATGGVYFVTLIGGIAALWGLSRVLFRPPRLRITEDGIVDRTFWASPGLIRWEEIVDIRRTRFWMVDIDLADEAGFWERMSPLEHLARWKFPLYGWGPAAFTPVFLEATRGEVIEALQAGLDAYTLAEARRDRAVSDADGSRLGPADDRGSPSPPAPSV